MSEEALISEDQSHYEVSLTAGQAFLAFVLLLLSLAASFAFGLMIGRGQAEERAVARKEAPVVNEIATTTKKDTTVVQPVGIGEDAFEIVEEPSGAPPTPAASVAKDRAVPPQSAPTADTAVAPLKTAVPHIAQLFSSSDQKAAEGMAARLIDSGFPNTYVERGTNDKGQVFRVRVKFASLEEAKASEAKLKGFSKEVWITKQ
jgi:hypothetical protein